MKDKNIRKPYLRPKTDKNDGDETIKILDDIAVLQPGKNAQIAAKKISEKHKEIREAKTKKRFNLPGEEAVGDTIETKDRDKIEIVVPPSKISSQKAAKKIKDKYDRLRRNKVKSKKIVESNKKNKILKEIDTIDEVKTASDKKRTRVTAQKILKKYKNMKRSEKTYLVNEEDIETIDYSKPQEDLFAGESILNAANKLLNFNQFKKEQEKLLKKGKNGKQIKAKDILKKIQEHEKT